MESIDNPGLADYTITAATPLELMYKPDLLGGINTITGRATDSTVKRINFTAIPFYGFGNREGGPNTGFG